MFLAPSLVAMHNLHFQLPHQCSQYLVKLFEFECLFTGAKVAPPKVSVVWSLSFSFHVDIRILGIAVDLSGQDGLGHSHFWLSDRLSMEGVELLARLHFQCWLQSWGYLGNIKRLQYMEIPRYVWTTEEDGLCLHIIGRNDRASLIPTFLHTADNNNSIITQSPV